MHAKMNRMRQVGVLAFAIAGCSRVGDDGSARHRKEAKAVRSKGRERTGNGPARAGVRVQISDSPLRSSAQPPASPKTIASPKIPFAFAIRGFDRSKKCCSGSEFRKNELRAGVYVQVSRHPFTSYHPPVTGPPVFLKWSSPTVLVHWLKHSRIRETHRKYVGPLFDVYQGKRRVCRGTVKRLSLLSSAYLHHARLIHDEDRLKNRSAPRNKILKDTAADVFNFASHVVAGKLEGCRLTRDPVSIWARSAEAPRPLFHRVGVQNGVTQALAKRAKERIRYSRVLRDMREAARDKAGTKISVSQKVFVHSPPKGTNHPYLVETLTDVTGGSGMDYAAGRIFRLWMVRSGYWVRLMTSKIGLDVALASDLDGDGKLEILIDSPRECVNEVTRVLYRVDGTKLTKITSTGYSHHDNDCGGNL